jgi:sugar-specific transcriptional regulator TrmB
MDTQTLLKEYGLTEKEIAVYLALIKLGPSPVRILAVASKVNRGTTYDILKNLVAQGLVSYYNKASHQYFAAEKPEKLILAVEQKQRSLEEVKKNIEANLPMLKASFEKQGGKPVMKLYEGSEGLRQILEDVLLVLSDAASKEYYVYSSGDEAHRKVIYKDFLNFSKQRVAKKIAVKTIVLGFGGGLIGLDERKWIKPQNQEFKMTHQIIYGGKLALMTVDDSGNPIGVLIENEAIYETQKMIFEFNWNQL